MAETRTVTTLSEALRAAAEVGYPVVLKADVDGVAHKADAGVVRLHLHSPDSLRAAFEELTADLTTAPGQPSPRFAVQAQADAALEVIAGVRIDPKFGPVTVVGLGGINTEAFDQASVRLGAVDPPTAREMFSETLVGRLLAGRHGRRPLDAEAAARAVAALSRFGVGMRGVLTTVEVNPLMVFGEGGGALGVDVLMEWESDSASGSAHDGVSREVDDGAR